MKQTNDCRITIRIPTQPTPAEEVEMIRQLTNKLAKTDSRLKSFFTSDLRDWLTECMVKEKTVPDLFEIYRYQSQQLFGLQHEKRKWEKQVIDLEYKIRELKYDKGHTRDEITRRERSKTNKMRYKLRKTIEANTKLKQLLEETLDETQKLCETIGLAIGSKGDYFRRVKQILDKEDKDDNHAS